MLDKEIGEVLTSIENFAESETKQKDFRGADLQDVKRSFYDNIAIHNTPHRSPRSLEVYYHPTRTKHYYKNKKYLKWRAHHRNHRRKVYGIGEGADIHHPQFRTHIHHRRRHSRVHDRQKFFFEGERNYHLGRRHSYHFYVRMEPAERTLRHRRLQTSKRKRKYGGRKYMHWSRINKLKEPIQFTRQRYRYIKRHRKHHIRKNRLFQIPRDGRIARPRKKIKYLPPRIFNEENSGRRRKKNFMSYNSRRARILKNHVKDLKEKLFEKSEIDIKIRQWIEARCVEYKEQLKKIVAKANRSLRRAAILGNIIGKKFGIDQRIIDGIIRKEQGKVSSNFFSIFEDV